MTEEGWYFTLNEEKHGPVTRAELTQAIEEFGGQVRMLVWHPDLDGDDWHSVEKPDDITPLFLPADRRGRQAKRQPPARGKPAAYAPLVKLLVFGIILLCCVYFFPAAQGVLKAYEENHCHGAGREARVLELFTELNPADSSGFKALQLSDVSIGAGEVCSGTILGNDQISYGVEYRTISQPQGQQIYVSVPSEGYACDHPVSRKQFTAILDKSEPFRKYGANVAGMTNVQQISQSGTSRTCTADFQTTVGVTLKGTMEISKVNDSFRYKVEFTPR